MIGGGDGWARNACATDSPTRRPRLPGCAPRRRARDRATAPAGSLTLQAALERALAANPTIAAARLGRAIDVAGLALAGERLNPEASFEIEKETPKQSFGFAVPLELGGKRAKRIAVGEATIRAGEAELAATIAQVRNDVRRVYFEALVADARSSVLRELRDLSQRARDTAQARFDSGDAPRLEVLQADLALATAENEATAADGVALAARSKLNALLALPLDTVQPLSTPLDAGGAVVTERGARPGASRQHRARGARPPNREQRAKLALAQRAARARRHADCHAHARRAARVHLRVARRRRRHAPALHDPQGGRDGRGQPRSTQLTAQRQAALLRIDGDVTAAAAIAEAQRQAYVRYRDEILPQAQQVEQLAQDSYQLGQTGIAALLQALQASRDVRLRSLDAVSQFQTALADLERAIGAPLP